MNQTISPLAQAHLTHPASDRVRRNEALLPPSDTLQHRTGPNLWWIWVKDSLLKGIAAVMLLIAVALGIACGGGGGASTECLDTLYSGTMDEETRKQLSQPIAKMDAPARLAAIKALSHQGMYRKNAESAECGSFVQELEIWEDTSEGMKWHEDNGPQIASFLVSFLGN